MRARTTWAVSGIWPRPALLACAAAGSGSCFFRPIVDLEPGRHTGGGPPAIRVAEVRVADARYLGNHGAGESRVGTMPLERDFRRWFEWAVATVPWSERTPARSVAEAVDSLLGELRRPVERPR